MQAGEAFLKYEKYSGELQSALGSAVGLSQAESLIISVSPQEFEALWDNGDFQTRMRPKLEAGYSQESKRFAEALSEIVPDDTQSSAAA